MKPRDDGEYEQDYKIVSIRLRMAEFESFNDQVQKLGLSSNMALRIAARRIGGFLEIDADVRSQLEAILNALGGISRNIGQLCSDYAACPQCDLGVLASQRALFGQEFAYLDALLRSILNISQRRLDGCQRLQEALV